MWGLFCPLWLPIGGWRGPKYGYFWGKNPAFMAGGFQGEITPANGLMSHITPQWMEYHCLRPFWPFPGTYPGLQGSKNGYFYGWSKTKMADRLQDENYTWKLFNETYQTQMHGKSLFKAILALSRHLSRVTGVQRWLFLWRKQDQNGRPAPGWK